jgi:hypothetical protein
MFDATDLTIGSKDAQLKIFPSRVRDNRTLCAIIALHSRPASCKGPKEALWHSTSIAET